MYSSSPYSTFLSIIFLSINICRLSSNRFSTSLLIFSSIILVYNLNTTDDKHRTKDNFHSLYCHPSCVWVGTNKFSPQFLSILFVLHVCLSISTSHFFPSVASHLIISRSITTYTHFSTFNSFQSPPSGFRYVIFSCTSIVCPI